MRTATDSAFIAEPIGHISIGVRDNVNIYSTDNRSMTRGGVTFVSNLKATGPLTLPGPPLG